ncbi:MAG: hypothetical protein KBD78_13800 [Oligoflexales bacterium]|nr:hypothetical protein [Oligoflexales bacterium]
MPADIKLLIFLIKSSAILILMALFSQSALTAQSFDTGYYSKDCRVASTGLAIPCGFVGINTDLAREFEGHCPSRMGLDVPTPNDLAQMNIKWLRQDKGWLDVLGRKSAANLGLSEDAGYLRAYGKLAEFKALGVKVMLVIHGDYYGSATKLLQAFGPIVDAWQIGNEPDIAISIRGIIPVPQYAADLELAYNEIRTAYVDYYKSQGIPISSVQIPPIITAGFASKDPAYFRQVLAQLGTKRPFDGVGVHLYAVNTTSMNFPFASPPANQQLKNVVASFYAASPDHPIWITEVGLQQGRARTDVVKRFMRAAYNDMQAIGNEGIKVANTFWFGWHNVEPHTYGLVELCGQKKEPEYQEFKNIASEIIQ